MKGKSLVGIGAVLALVLAGAATWAWAQGDDVLYYACVNNSSGTIHMVEAGDSCRNNEHLIMWNSSGPAGSAEELRFYTRGEAVPVDPGVVTYNSVGCDPGDIATGGGFNASSCTNVIASLPTLDADDRPVQWQVGFASSCSFTYNAYVVVVCADLSP